MTSTTSRQVSLRERLGQVLAEPWFERTITALIVLNAVTLGLETSPTAMSAVGPLIEVVDRAILGIFALEIATRIFVRRAAILRDPWAIFDIIVVGIALVPATGDFSVLRALRVLRLVSTVKSMRRVVGGLLAALPGMLSIVVLLILIFYVFAVMATRLFGETFPDWFGTIGGSFYTLFQIMTLEGWSEEIVRPVMAEFPYAWAFFLPFILATSFTVLNLFIGIIVDAVQGQRDELLAEDFAHQHEETEAVLAELRALRQDVAELKASVSSDAIPPMAGPR